MTRFEQTQYLFDHFTQELHKGAEIMLAHFHQCNRNYYPFTIDWSSDESKRLGIFNKPQIDFMKETCRLIGENRKTSSLILTRVSIQSKFDR